MAIKKLINKTFSGTDMVVSVVFPKSKPIIVGQASTVTYSIYRDTHPVRTLSRINTQAFTKGPRTIAGTIIFTVFDKHMVNVFREHVSYLKERPKLKYCELPPFDIYITMANEYGGTARLNIYGVTIVDEGMVMSVEDMFTENQISYMAKDIMLLDDINSEQNLPITDFYHGDVIPTFKPDKLVMDDVYDKMVKEIQDLIAKEKAEVEAARKKAIEEAKRQAELIKKEIQEALEAEKKKKEAAQKAKDQETQNSTPQDNSKPKTETKPKPKTETKPTASNIFTHEVFDPTRLYYKVNGLTPKPQNPHIRVVVETIGTGIGNICKNVKFAICLIDPKTKKTLHERKGLTTGDRGGASIAVSNYRNIKPNPIIRIVLESAEGVCQDINSKNSDAGGVRCLIGHSAVEKNIVFDKSSSEIDSDNEVVFTMKYGNVYSNIPR